MNEVFLKTKRKVSRRFMSSRLVTTIDLYSVNKCLKGHKINDIIAFKIKRSTTLNDCKNNKWKIKILF